MQPEYLAQISPAVRSFVEEVEDASGFNIEVIPDAGLNAGGPFEQGTLKVEIGRHHARLLAPTNGYFPSGGVRHEVLHIWRLHVEGVPRLALAEEVHLDPAFEQSLARVDNALEHLVIVPLELQHHPERREHWEAVMTRHWLDELPHATFALDRRIGACLHWTFLRHVLGATPAAVSAEAFLLAHDLQAEADSFCDQLIPRLGNKVAVAQFFFDCFYEVPRNRAALEYLNGGVGGGGGVVSAPIPG